MNWKFTASGDMYTEPRSYSITRLQNGKWRLFCYASGLQFLHSTRLAALRHATDIEDRAR